MATRRLTTCERLAEKYKDFDPFIITTEAGQQIRFTIDAGEVVANWVTKKDRLTYSSGFLFGDCSIKKLSARDITSLLDEAATLRLSGDS